MDLMRLLIRVSQIARTRQPMWKIWMIAMVVALCAVAGLIEWAGLWPEWLHAGRVRPHRL